MIIFDLDGTLADCEHRRHFVNCYDYDQSSKGYIQEKTCNRSSHHFTGGWIHKNTNKRWKPDWGSFYDACDQDTPIESVCAILDSMMVNTQDIEIWSGRCESVRKKTEDWFEKYIRNIYVGWNFELILKMRPIGNSTPDDQLKEKWLDETLAEGKKIDFVFDDREKVVRMWLRRGIFVFDVSQGKGDF